MIPLGISRKMCFYQVLPLERLKIQPFHDFYSVLPPPLHANPYASAEVQTQSYLIFWSSIEKASFLVSVKSYNILQIHIIMLETFRKFFELHSLTDYISSFR